MTAQPGGIWLTGLLMLSLVGCTTLSPSKAPPSTPPSAVETPPPAPLPAGRHGEPRPPAPEPRTPEPAPSPPRAQAAPEPPAAPRPTAPAAPATPAAQRGRFVVLNFDNADIEVVIHAASEIVGFNYVLAPDVKGKVTVQTSGRIPQEEVFNVLLAILEVHGFTAVKSENLYKIVKTSAARERPIPTIVGKEPEKARTGDEMITQIVPLRFISTADAVNLLRPLSPQGNLIPHRETNLLIITDTAANIRRLLEILRLVDVEVALDDLQIIPLKFADAQELAGILNQLFGTGRFRATPTAVPGMPPPPPVPGVPPAPRAVAEAAPGERPPLIVPERRSNSLIVHARKQEMEMIRKLIGQLDVDIYGGRQIFIYYAENGKAKDLAATMNAIYGKGDGAAPPAPRPPGAPPAPGAPPTPAPPAIRQPEGAELALGRGEVRFIADEPTNAVIVTTYPRNWPEIEDTLKKLDRMPRQVLIEVLVAEITLTDDIKLGIEWAVRAGRFDFFNSPSGTLGARPTFSIPSGAATAVTAGLNFFTFETGQFFTLLNALATDNKVNVLSSPSILTSENKKAVINVSDSIPIVTSQQVPTAAGTTGGTAGAVITQTVEYKDAGIILTVTPRIGEKGTVALDIKQEVNDIGAEEGITRSRRIIKREAETSVVMVNNQSLVLGGLIKNKRTVDQKGIPLLSKIPLLGLLFGTSEEKIEKTELLILITPRVIGTALEAARLTEEMKKITPRIEESIKLAPRQPTPPPPSAK